MSTNSLPRASKSNDNSDKFAKDFVNRLSEYNKYIKEYFSGKKNTKDSNAQDNIEILNSDFKKNHEKGLKAHESAVEELKKIFNLQKEQLNLLPIEANSSKDNQSVFFKDFTNRLNEYKNLIIGKNKPNKEKEKSSSTKNTPLSKEYLTNQNNTNNDQLEKIVELQSNQVEILDKILGESILTRKLTEGSIKKDISGKTAGRYRDTKSGQLIGTGIENASEEDIESIKTIKKNVDEQTKLKTLQELKLEKKDISKVKKDFKETRISEEEFNKSISDIKEKYKESREKIREESNVEVAKLIKQSRREKLQKESILGTNRRNSNLLSSANTSANVQAMPPMQQQNIFDNKKITEDISSMKKAMLGDGIAVKIMNPEEIKNEGGGAGGLLPDIELPGKGKIGSPGGATKASIGSRALKFMTGTGGKVLGAAAAVGLGAYTAYSGYTEAEEKKQQEIQAIDEKVKSGEIAPEKAEELKKEISAKTTEDKGGAIGKGTGMAAGAIGGGIAGAKVGATIGTFLGGPLGTAIGGAVGGLAGGAIGAISGSSVGQNIGGTIGKGVAGVKGFLGIKDSEEITKTSERVEKESTDIQFSEMEFAKNDPENYKKFVDHREQLTKELYENELKNRKLTEKSSPVILRGIKQEVQIKAKIEAIKKFKKEIEAAGAGYLETKKRKDIEYAPSTKSDTSAVTSAPSTKSDTSTVTSAPSTKSDTSAVTSAPSTKSDTSAVTSAVTSAPSTKSDTSAVTSAVTSAPSTKSDTSAVTSAVTSAPSTKSDTSAVTSAVTSAPSTKSDTSAVTTNKESFKGSFIAKEPVIPGKPLSEKQMAVIEMSKSQGNKYSPEVEAQYQKQKLEQLQPSTNVETSKPADRAAPLQRISQENEELKREQSTPIIAPPIISNSVQSTNTQTLAPIKAQPRSATSSSLEKYIERTAVYA